MTELTAQIDKSDPRAGSSVIAFLAIDSDLKIIHYLGEGVYVGNAYAKDVENEQVRKIMKEQHITKNPLILLDNGDIVYGCECWWVTKDKGLHEMRRLSSLGYEIYELRVDAARSLYAEAGEMTK
jgi:hypothetical protein